MRLSPIRARSALAIPPTRATTRAVALALAAGLSLAACSAPSDEAEPKSDDVTPAGQEVAEAEEIAATWPLTGLEVADSEDPLLKHPIMVTKVDNTSSSSPQVGLGKADLIVEELVEGGVTRLAVFFYSELPKEVGPVRSMRASDIGIVPPGASVVTSGAANVTIDRIQGAGIPFFSEGAKGIYRSSSRYAPYNLMANLGDVATAAKAPKQRPADYLPWGTSADLPKGKPARTIAADFGNHTTSWAFAKGSYGVTNSYAAQGDRFAADTVIAINVEIGDAGYKDPAGYPVPETKYVGSGTAFIFHAGRVVKATWSKDELTSQVSFTARGKELTIPAGHTWIELVPAATGAVSWSK